MPKEILLVVGVYPVTASELAVVCAQASDQLKCRVDPAAVVTALYGGLDNFRKVINACKVDPSRN